MGGSMGKWWPLYSSDSGNERSSGPNPVLLRMPHPPAREKGLWEGG